MREDILENKRLVLKWIREHRSKAFICRQLICQPAVLDRYLKEWSIQYKGNAGLKNYKESNKRKPALWYIENDKIISANRLKYKLFRDGIKDRMCERCKKVKWQGNLIPLELHHKDGNRFNNQLINLEILCPNCHALTDNHAGKNKKKNRINRKVGTKNKSIDVEIAELRLKEKKLFIKKCIRCALEYETKNEKRSFCSKSCSKKGNYKIEWPSDEVIKQLVQKFGYFRAGRELGVSDNAVRRRIRINKIDVQSKFAHTKIVK